MCSDCLVVIYDSSTFVVADPHEYCQNSTKFTGLSMANDSFFTSWPAKNESSAILSPINLVKFWQYSCGSVTPKVDESSITTKRSEHMVPHYSRNAENTKAGWGNTTYAHYALHQALILHFPSFLNPCTASALFCYIYCYFNFDRSNLLISFHIMFVVGLGCIRDCSDILALYYCH